MNTAPLNQTYGAPQNQVYTAPQNPTYTAPQVNYGQPVVEAKPLGMKWFKFLIYFSLFASALIYVGNAILLLTGSLYAYQGENISEFVYETFPDLAGIDMGFGAFAIVLALYSIVVRFSLANYKKSGPALLYGLYVAGIVFGLAYYAAASSAVGGINNDSLYAEMTSSYISSAAGSLLFLAYNIGYFKKRSHLFVK